MEQFIVFVIVIMVLYYMSKGFAKKEAASFQEASLEETEAFQLDQFDPIHEVVVDFTFSCPNTSFLITSFPNIIIGNEKFKMVNNQLRVRLPKSFTYRFGVPYMKGQSFKSKGTFDLEAGNHYHITFKARVFVFQKAKVTIEKIGVFNG